VDKIFSKDLKKLGLHIRSLRVKKDFTQDKLAESSNLSISQIGRIERGALNPSFTSLLSISKALKIPLEKVVAYNED
jgi:transcriptional regulator with XRE-family HTH domain